MTRLIQGFLMLVLTTLWVPSAGAWWAYCECFGLVHPASTACGCAGQDEDDCCDCCGDDEPEAPVGDDCCTAAGKMLPEALLPVTGSQVPHIPMVTESGLVRPVGSVIRPADTSFRTWHLRGPPPDRAVFLSLRSLRL